MERLEIREWVIIAGVVGMIAIVIATALYTCFIMA